MSDAAPSTPPLEPYAAMTVDLTGCEHLSRDIKGIEAIAASGAKGPTEVVYLYASPALAPPEIDKAGISVEMMGDGKTRVTVRAPADAFDKVFADGMAYVSTEPIEPTEYHHPEIDRLREENTELRHKLETTEIFEAMFKNHRDELLQAIAPSSRSEGGQGCFQVTPASSPSGLLSQVPEPSSARYAENAMPATNMPALLTNAAEALRPMADAVFNDNGDMTVNIFTPTSEECIRAYFAKKAIFTALTAAGMSRTLIGHIVDEVFDGAIEDTKVIEDIYAAIKRHEVPAPSIHVQGIHLTEWERTRLSQFASSNALTYMAHHAGGGLKAHEVEDMQRWSALSDKLRALATEGKA